jgi:TolB-like protein/DNA-binding winged helix-turn-helix (wHTH) protein
MFSKYARVGREPETDLLFTRAPASVYRFSNVEVDFRAGELRRSGLRIRIQNQPLQVLAILLRNPGEIVTREQFRELLWPADTFVDFDHGLNSAIKRLRDALDDDHDYPRLIETMPRHGYRFIAPVSEFPQPVHVSLLRQAPSETVLADSEGAVVSANSFHQWETRALHAGKQIRKGARICLGCGAALLVVVLFSKPTYGPQRYIGYRTGQELIVGVLPFQNLGGNSADYFIAEGMTQEVITELSRADKKHTKLLSGAALAPYKSTRNPISAMASELGVAYVLEGSTRIQGEKVRIAVQLIRTRDQSYVWADSYDGNVHDLLTAEATVAVAISHAVTERMPE